MSLYTCPRQGIALIYLTAKELSSDKVGAAAHAPDPSKCFEQKLQLDIQRFKPHFFLSILLSKVIVKASSPAVALAIDVSGRELEQEDIWVADFTEEEAKAFLSLYGHDNFDEFVDACVSAQFSQTWSRLFRSLTGVHSGGLGVGHLVKACENLERLVIVISICFS